MYLGHVEISKIFNKIDAAELMWCTLNYNHCAAHTHVLWHVYFAPKSIIVHTSDPVSVIAMQTCDKIWKNL